MTDKPNSAPDKRTDTAAPRNGMGLTEDELAVLADMPRQYARGTAHSIMGASRVISAAEKSTSIGKTADWL